MKTLQNFVRIRPGKLTLGTPAYFLITAILAATFWFSASPKGLAAGEQGPVATTPGTIVGGGGNGDPAGTGPGAKPGKILAPCSVCHRGTLTLTFACSDLEYRRHRDHGDPDGPCSATP